MPDARGRDARAERAGAAVHQGEAGAAGCAPFRMTALPDDRDFACEAGETLLDAALRAGLPIAHACGGKARCSTCRIWMIGGGDAAGVAPDGVPLSEAEAALKARLGLGPEIRLACQYRPASDVVFRRLIIDESDLAVANQLNRRQPAQAGEIRTVAVMFFDVAGFTELSDRLPPYDVMFLLNKFLSRAQRILARHGGYFDKAIGDGFVAIFGIDGSHDCALRAVAAALDVLAAVDQGKPMMRRLYDAAFDGRIGLHYGEALVGALGPADDQRLTVIGDVANIASRVESANKEAGTRLLITEELFAEVAGDVISPEFVRLRLAGTRAPRTLHEITGLTPDARERLETSLAMPAPGGGRNWLRVCGADELPEGAVRVFPQARYDVAVTRRDGRVHAFNNHCPHNRLAFFGAEITEDSGLPPTPACSPFPAHGQIACRFHGSVFDLETGQILSWCPLLEPDGTAHGLAVLGDLSKNEAPLEIYRCREADGDVWVEIV